MKRHSLLFLRVMKWHEGGSYSCNNHHWAPWKMSDGQQASSLCFSTLQYMHSRHSRVQAYVPHSVTLMFSWCFYWTIRGGGGPTQTRVGPCCIQQSTISINPCLIIRRPGSYNYKKRFGNDQKILQNYQKNVKKRESYASLFFSWNWNWNSSLHIYIMSLWLETGEATHNCSG